MDAAVATAARPASSKQQRSLENSFAVQSRESIDEKIAACFYALRERHLVRHPA